MTNRGAVSNTEAPQCSSRGSPSHPSISQVTPSTRLVLVQTNKLIYQYLQGNIKISQVIET